METRQIVAAFVRVLSLQYFLGLVWELNRFYDSFKKIFEGFSKEGTPEFYFSIFVLQGIGYSVLCGVLLWIFCGRISDFISKTLSSKVSSGSWDILIASLIRVKSLNYFLGLVSSLGMFWFQWIQFSQMKSHSYTSDFEKLTFQNLMITDGVQFGEEIFIGMILWFFAAKIASFITKTMRCAS